jgi:hypothetical protein
MTSPAEFPTARLQLVWTIAIVDTAAGPDRIPLASRWLRRAWRAAYERLRAA